MKRLWPYVLRYRLLFLASTGLVFLTTACALVPPWLLGYTVDHVLLKGATGLLVPFALLFFGVDLVRAVSMFAQSYLLTLVGQRVLHDLRQDLLRQYEFYPIEQFTKTPTGRLVTRLVNDTSSLQDLFTGGLAVAVGESAVVVGIIIWLVVLHPALGLVCVSVFPLMFLAARFFSKRIRESFRKSRSALSKLNGYLAENISGMWIIQVFNLERPFRERFEDVSREYTRTQINTIWNFAYFQPTITVLSSLSMALLIWYGGHRVLHEAITIGLLVTFMSYLQALYAPIRDITEKYNLFVAAVTSCDRIFDFMDRPREIGTDSQVVHVAPAALDGRIEFRGVSFRYGEPWILKNLSFTIEAGEKVGIVGRTGAGKTTLSSLLLRFYDPQQGSILLSGKDALEIDKRAIRQAIGHIQQHPFLFAGTVEENVLLWHEENRKTLEKFPELTSHIDFKKKVFEKGSNLSTGEQQILALLRALSQDPRILILDEATAHVDSLTERKITTAAERAFSGRTALIIAHRLATLRSVDRILVMHHGELVETGTHTQLVAHRGIYQKLYDIQSRREELAARVKPAPENQPLLNT